MDINAKNASLLLVVDDESKASRLRAALEPDGYTLEAILSLQGPLPRPALDNPDLAILWFPFSSPEALPELENIIRQLQGLGDQEPLPVLLIIDQYGSHWVEPGFKLGVSDILSRPIHPLVLRQRVRLLLQARQTEQAVARHLQTEQALNAERQHLFKVLDLLPAYIYLQAPDYSIPFANRTFRKWFGDPGQRRCYEVLRRQPQPCTECAAMRALQTHAQVQWEWSRPDGRTFMVYNNAFKDTTGTDLVLEIGIDITDRKQGELALLREEERFRTVADFTYDWEYWVDRDGSLLYNSPACERITGHPSQAFLEDPHLLVEIVHPEDRLRFEQHRVAEQQTGEVYSLDFRIQTAGGQERWIGHACQPVFSQEGQSRGRRVSNRDITDRKSAEQALARTERLAAMGRLVSTLAHEINNPLQALYSSIELVMDFPLEAGERNRYLEFIRREIERLMDLNRGILDFSRPKPVEAQPTVLKSVVEHALFLAARQLKENQVEVKVSLPSDLPILWVSQDQIGQVFLNLVLNAAEHMPDGGCLEITACHAADFVEVAFKDNGQGIPPAALDLIFEPFYSTKQGGTGLGLAVSQSIAQNHGGELLASSVMGKGSTFTLKLPLKSPLALPRMG